MTIFRAIRDPLNEFQARSVLKKVEKAPFNLAHEFQQFAKTPVVGVVTDKDLETTLGPLYPVRLAASEIAHAIVPPAMSKIVGELPETTHVLVDVQKLNRIAGNNPGFRVVTGGRQPS
jgi:hypothetical protein